MLSPSWKIAQQPKIRRLFETLASILLGHPPQPDLPGGRQSRPGQPGAPERRACNESLYLAEIIRLRLRQAARSGVIACHCCFRGVSYLLVSDWPKTFKEAFCERYRCPSDQYLRRAFRKCLYRRAALLAPIIMAVSPAFFQVDMDVIERIGSARSWRELHAELKAFSINSRLRTRPLRSQFRLRVSGNRICKLAEVLFGPQKSSSGGR